MYCGIGPEVSGHSRLTITYHRLSELVQHKDRSNMRVAKLVGIATDDFVHRKSFPFSFATCVLYIL